ncbi:hypothetical protein OJ253_3583 [Cryptosporidium canis]|uniref:Uncharacterized protein n=1 Tax=Cryptosporidium canis TaxID=195482 RepID=A0A9D5DJH7_9CRYT|nr:hypothetical protein OJ253_3583 [Cryptosporidium canis]
MDFLNYHYNGLTESSFQKEPDLKCCSYLAYPEFDQSVYDNSEIQLKLCIMELYDLVHNRDGCIQDGFEEGSGLQKRDLLSKISEISSVISVCMETRLDVNDSAEVHFSQMQRLTEQRRNIERIRENVGEQKVLRDILDKISNSIQNQLFCLSKIVGTAEISSPKQEIYYDIDSGLTPLRIKYPYLTGTYTLLNYNGVDGSPLAFQYQEKKATSLAGASAETVHRAHIVNRAPGRFMYESECRSIEDAERSARIKLRNKKQANLQVGAKDRGTKEYHIVRDSHSNPRAGKPGKPVSEMLGDSRNENSGQEQEQELGLEKEPAILEKFSGGITRLIVDKDRIRQVGGRSSLLQIDGWGLIEHERARRPTSSRHNHKVNRSDSEEEYTLDSSKDGIQADSRAKARRGRVSSLNTKDSGFDDFDSGNTNTTETTYHHNRDTSRGEEGGANRVGVLRGKFEKESKGRSERRVGIKEEDVEFVEDFGDWKSEGSGTRGGEANNRGSGDKMTSTDSGRIGRFRLDCFGSGMPSQYTNTGGRQLSNYRDTMYSTSSWLPLTRNTGFNYECLYSNSDKNSSRPSGSEYNPAAEYARFSNAVGKVIHPIIADESYRDNGKNIMNPKKLFNAKFGTLTEDTFKEIQEKLRLKMEGWTIHGSGLQDPRANLFWDPAVMTAASTVSPFYTNMPSSNSPLLTNTLIPTSNGVSRRQVFAEPIGISRFQSQRNLNKEEKPEFILDSSEIHPTSCPNHKSHINPAQSDISPTGCTQPLPPTNSKQFPIKSMKELARGRNK